MRIAIDFDGTIVEHEYPKIGKPKLFAFDVLRNLQKAGHQLILWTVREGELLEEAVEFCRSHGVEFYAVNKNYPEEVYEPGKTNRKILADLYIDDRNLGGLPDWTQIWKMITGEEAQLKQKEKQVKRGFWSLFSQGS